MKEAFEFLQDVSLRTFGSSWAELQERNEKTFTPALARCAEENGMRRSKTEKLPSLNTCYEISYFRDAVSWKKHWREGIGKKKEGARSEDFIVVAWAEYEWRKEECL